jgi:hypothetical protein
MHRMIAFAWPGEILSSSDLLGTWSGTASNGYSFAYTFEATRFTWSLVRARGNVVIADGTFSMTGGKLILDGTFRGEDGPSRTRVELSPFVSSSVLCDSAFTSESHDREVGRWTNVMTVQSLDDDDMPLGEPRTVVQVLDLDADGTVAEITAGGALRRGTYVRTGDRITMTFTSGNFSTVRTYTLVDDFALCDPLYRRLLA